MSGRQLDVRVNDHLVGCLREENDLWQFEYDEAWQVSPDGFDLSPALSRQQRVHADGATMRPVQWYFDNLLPEEALRAVIAKEANLEAEDAFALLAYFGAESAGSLVLRAQDDHTPAEKGLKPLPLEELNRRIINLPHVSLMKEAPKRMSLAGAQHKMLVVLKGGELFEPLPGTPSTHILKPNHQGTDYPASVMNEYFTMRLAKAVGLDVADVHRIYTPQPVYIVERFDRYIPSSKGAQGDAGAAEVKRLHAIDTCQLLNKSRVFKYTAANMQTLAMAVGHTRSKAAARMQLFRWLVFNLLVGNGDNHLKNITFLVDAHGINVAPAYDLLCTAVYDTKAQADEKARWPATELAFALNDAKTFEGVTRQHVLDAAKELGLTVPTATRELDRLRSAVHVEAEKLLKEIQAKVPQETGECPDPEEARKLVGGELRILRAITHIILPDMARQLA